MGTQVPVLGHDDAVAKIAGSGRGAGLRHIHLFSWRDLADVEAGGSEVHAANVARLWAEAGLEVTLRTSYAQGQPKTHARRLPGRAQGGSLPGVPPVRRRRARRPHGPPRTPVEYWNGMPFFSPRCGSANPSIVVLHHVHAEMWKMVLGEDNPGLARAGELLEAKVARCCTGGAASSPSRPPRRTTSWSRCG